MNYALMCDLGSTFTKVRIISLDDGLLIASGQAPTTADSDLRGGLLQAVRAAGSPYTLEGASVLAGCSSAAGGLRMAAIGLIPSLTVSAAREAALGAGARLVGTFAHELTDCDLDLIDALACDVILLAGGTDGGDSRAVNFNAERLAERQTTAAVVYAGNRAAAASVTAILSEAGIRVAVAANVLPNLHLLNIEPARAAIRELFLHHIIHAKGMEPVAETLGGTLVPTPLAVLEAASLLSHGTHSQPGLGDVMVIDLGGATTDVHSVGKGSPLVPGTVWQGIPEPLEKRTVEADLGMRVNAIGILEQLRGGREFQEDLDGITEGALERYAAQITCDTASVPRSESGMHLDGALARIAVDVAVGRHVGQVRRNYGPYGEVVIQTGKDLSDVHWLVGTGGVFAYQQLGADVLSVALARNSRQDQLRPRDAVPLIDSAYIMAAAGLLSSTHADVALALMRSAFASTCS